MTLISNLLLGWSGHLRLGLTAVGTYIADKVLPNMLQNLRQALQSSSFVDLVQEKLPLAFEMAEADSKRGGKVGMEVGNLRERILIALFEEVLGSDQVNSEVPTTDSETDVILMGESLSIKTITGSVSGIKLIWTVDWSLVEQFVSEYEPHASLCVVQVRWAAEGGIYFIDRKTQREVRRELGNEYFKVPKQGTNPRGVELSKLGADQLIAAARTIRIPINWDRQVPWTYDPTQRWREFWRQCRSGT